MITPQVIATRIRALPTLSTTVSRLTQLLHDDHAGVSDFEEVIRPDPALTANLLRASNAAFFGRRRRVETAREAIMTVGLERVLGLAASASMAKAIPVRIPGYEIDAAAFWQHSVAVGVLSERLAAELGVKKPDMVFTAGLLHDLGKLVVGTFVSNESGPILERTRVGSIAFVDAEREALGTDHAEVGLAVAEHWGLPEAVGAAARWHHRPGDVREGDIPGLADLVHVADGLAHALGLGADAGELARKMDGTTVEILGIRPKRLERVASGSLEQIREMVHAFDPGTGGSVR